MGRKRAGSRGGIASLPGLLRIWVLSAVTVFIPIVLLTGCSDPRRGTVVIEEGPPEAGGDAENDDSVAERTGMGPQTACAEEQPGIFVFVCGAVREPSVYELPEGARARDALEAAGGFADQADTEYVNLAQLLSDGQQLRFPTVDEAEELRQRGLTGSAGDAQGYGEAPPVNINTAGVSELMTLPGIGEIRAEAIIRYRTTQGPFSSPEEIMKVSGIGQASFERLRDRITAR